jgi:tRNA (guanine-N7-)-methyltransferase
MTDAQRRALADTLPRFALPADQPADFTNIFGRTAPVIAEIGFGNGDALLAAARAAPERDFIGIEVHRPGVARVCMELERAPIANIRLVVADATDWLAQQVTDGSLSEIHIFFPDPWPKKRHHKRRLIQPPFAALLRAKLAMGGRLRLATDWEDYATGMLSVLSATPGLVNEAGNGFAPRFVDRPETKFERRGSKLGHRTWDLSFRRYGT